MFSNKINDIVEWFENLFKFPSPFGVICSLISNENV